MHKSRWNACALEVDARRRVTHLNRFQPPTLTCLLFPFHDLPPTLSTHKIDTMNTVDIQQLKSGEVNLGVRLLLSTITARILSGS